MNLATLQSLIVLVGRLFLADIFIYEGWLKITDTAGTIAYMGAYGVPAMLLPLVILTELGGGLCVAFGLFARWAAFALAGFCLLTALFFHRDFADTQNLQMVHFMKNVSMAGGFLMLTAYGAGRWSLDAVLSRRRGTAGGTGR
jgi:putative oxidoreductase